MSALTPEKVCDSYKWLLHIGNNTLDGSTLYTGIGSAVPVTFLNSTVMSTTAINIASITSSQPFKVKIAGALSAVSFLMGASASDGSNTAARMIDNNNSGIAVVDSSTFGGISGSGVVNNFFNTRQFSSLNIFGRMYSSHIIQNDSSDLYRDQIHNSFIPNCASGQFCCVWNSHGYAPFTFNSFSLYTFTVPNSASFEAFGASNRSSYSGCCAESSLRSNNADINSGQVGINNDTPRYNTFGVRYAANNSASNVKKYNSFEHVFGSTSYSANENYLVNVFHTGGVNAANNKNTTFLYPTGNPTNTHNSLVIGGSNTCRVTNSFSRESLSFCMSGNNIFAMNNMPGIVANKLSSTEPIYYNSCWAFVSDKILNVINIAAGQWNACISCNTFSMGGQAYADNSIQMAQDWGSNRSCVTVGATNSVVMNSACTPTVAISAANSTSVAGYGVALAGRNSFGNLYGQSFLNGRNSASITSSNFSNGLSANYLNIQNSDIYFDDLPGSSAGLPCGHLWVDPGTRNLHIVLA